MQWRRFGPSIICCDPEEQLFLVFGLFRCFNEDIPIFVLIKNACIDQIVFFFGLRAFGILSNQIFIGKFLLWVFI